MIRRRISLKRRILFTVLILMSTLVAVELTAQCAVRYFDGGFSFAAVHHLLREIQTGELVTDGGAETIHPYLGWVTNPQLAGPSRHFGRDVRVNDLGFRDCSDGIYQRSADVFILGLAGGSVAWQLALESGALLEKELSSLPELKGRRVQVVSLAAPGYKQPQQVIALNYFMALGGEFDAVVNIDGYNEFALSVCENFESQTCLAYPRSWPARSVQLHHPAESQNAFELLRLKSQRISRAQLLENSVLRHSALCCLIWKLRDESNRNSINELGWKLLNSREGSFINHGPQPACEDEAAAMRESIRLWAACSKQMASVCDGSRTIYLHVLQPNQYFEGSKPLSDLELRKYYVSGQDQGRIVNSAYPLAIDAGRKLAEQGVTFVDATMLFKETTETTYNDYYCHYNKLGNEMLTRYIIAELKKQLRDAVLSASTAERYPQAG